jgi:hypothetical protein
MLDAIRDLLGDTMNGKRKHKKFKLDKVIVILVFKKKKKHR